MLAGLKIINLLVVPLFFASLMLSDVSAQSGNEFQVKVQTRMEYSEDNLHGIRRKLIHQFKIDALKKSTSSMPNAKAKLINQYFEEMTQHEVIDQFFVGITTAGECNTATGDNCGTVNDKSLILRGIANLNMTQIDNFLQSKSAAANQGATSEFAVLFIARQVSSKKEYKEKETAVIRSKNAKSLENTEGGDDVSIEQGISNENIEFTQQGGSVEIKADQFAYEIDLGLTEKLGNAILKYLVDAGFEPFFVDDYVEDGDYDYLYLDEMVEEGYFGEDGTLNRRTLNAIKKATMDQEIRFLGIGKVDYRLPETDEYSGGLRVPAYVTVEVQMVKGRRMRTVASVEPVLVFGSMEEGGDPTVGQIRAQDAAVARAMDEIIAQLQSKGLY